MNTLEVSNLPLEFDLNDLKNVFLSFGEIS